MARILIVDDEPELRQMLQLMLERVGHRCIMASNGTEALALAVAERPDLIVLDVMMPDKSGYDTARQLRANSQTANVPILILTARTQTMDEDMAHEAGADAFLPKPVTGQVLVSEVNALLGERADWVSQQKMRPITTVLGLRGGVGATTIAVNLALSLAKRGLRVCLVDLSPFGGHAALLLRIAPRRGWSVFLSAEEMPSKAAIQETLVAYKKYSLSILPAPKVPPRAELSEAVAQHLIKNLLEDFDQIVIDTPALGPASMATLRASRTIILPMSDDVPSIQTITGVMSTLRELEIASDRVHVVLNRVRPEVSLSAQAVQQAVKRQLAAELPYEPAQHTSMSHGIPLIEAQPECMFSKRILHLARNI